MHAPHAITADDTARIVADSIVADSIVALGGSRGDRVLFATAELSPLCRVGGLAEASAGLVAALRRGGMAVDVVVPDYGNFVGFDEISRRRLDVPAWVGDCVARAGMVEGIGRVIAVAGAGIERPHPYNDPATGLGWADNDRRFLGFSAAVAALAAELRPAVVHLNDWHTAAATAWLDADQPVVLTVHNLAYQGDTGREWLSVLDEWSEAFDVDGACNPLAGGIALADRVVAVSPTYAVETRRRGGGSGLDALLRAKRRGYGGIRNGIDVDQWDPRRDRFLPTTFCPDDLSGKSGCRAELVARAGLVDDGEPIVAVLSRFVDQKGIDVALDLARHLPAMSARMVLMGRGEPHLERSAAAMAASQPGRVAYLPEVAESMAHLVVAGSDLLLVPSRFEPCGLTPMEAMRCGTVPVVNPVGGLRDSVIDASIDPVDGNGFVAPTADVAGLVAALSRAVRTLADPQRKRSIQRSGMTADWSWDLPAAAYRDVYAQVSGHRVTPSAPPIALQPAPASDPVLA